MTIQESIEAALAIFYQDRSDVQGRPGYLDAMKCWDTIRNKSSDAETIWLSALRAQSADRAAWGSFRALVEAWLLHVRPAFAFPPLPDAPK
jgi:hypothetical protein